MNKYFEEKKEDRVKKDMFNRVLKEGDKCVKISGGGNSFNRPTISIVEVQRFTPERVQIGERRYVDPGSLVKLTEEGL